MAHREDKLNAHFAKLAGEFMLHATNPKISLVTVTDFHVDADFRNAVAYISVFPEKEGESAVEMLNRKSRDFKEFLKSKSRMRAIPHTRFELDRGEQNRQRIDELIRK